MLFPLIETIAVENGKLQNLSYHQQRYREALAEYYPNQAVVMRNLSDITPPPEFQQGLVRCRIDYNATQQQVRFFRAQFDLDTDYVFGIFNASETRLLGGTGLHKRGREHRLEIGYWIHAQAVGKGYVTEAVKALTYNAFYYHGVKGLDICCDPRNQSSYAVAERCGFVHKETFSGRDQTPDGKPRDTMIWRLERPEVLAIPFPMHIYDAAQNLL